MLKLSIEKIVRQTELVGYSIGLCGIPEVVGQKAPELQLTHYNPKCFDNDNVELKILCRVFTSVPKYIYMLVDVKQDGYQILENREINSKDDVTFEYMIPRPIGLKEVYKFDILFVPPPFLGTEKRIKLIEKSEK